MAPCEIQRLRDDIIEFSDTLLYPSWSRQDHKGRAMTTYPRTPRRTPDAIDEAGRRELIMDGTIAAHAIQYSCTELLATDHHSDYLRCPFCGIVGHRQHGKLRQCPNGHSMVALGNGLFAWPDNTAPKEQILEDATPQERHQQRVTTMARRGEWRELAQFLTESLNPAQPEDAETVHEPKDATPEPTPRKLGMLRRFLTKNGEGP